MPTGAWLYTWGAFGRGRGAAGITEQIMEGAVAGQALYYLLFCFRRPLGPGFSKGPLGYTPYSHHLSSTQADFLKMSSAIWWQAEAVTGVEELGNWVPPRGLPFRTPVSREAAQHWLAHG